MTETQTAIHEAAKQMKDAVNGLGLGIEIGAIHHAPGSNSIYYKLQHDEMNHGRPETVRLSDHENHRQSSYMLWDIILPPHGFGASAAEQIAEFVEDLELMLE